MNWIEILSNRLTDHSYKFKLLNTLIIVGKLNLLEDWS